MTINGKRCIPKQEFSPTADTKRFATSGSVSQHSARLKRGSRDPLADYCYLLFALFDALGFDSIVFIQKLIQFGAVSACNPPADAAVNPISEAIGVIPTASSSSLHRASLD
jgi:hypothetical protein